MELLAPSASGDDAGQVVSCEYQEISRDGLRVQVDAELTLSSILQIGIEVESTGETLFLVGQVRWCQSVSDSLWSVGFELFEATDSDIDTWHTLLEPFDAGVV